METGNPYNSHLAMNITEGMEMLLEMETYRDYLMSLPIEKLEALDDSISEQLLGISKYNTDVIRRMVEDTKSIDEKK